MPQQQHNERSGLAPFCFQLIAAAEKKQQSHRLQCKSPVMKCVWDLLANQQTKLCFHRGCPALSHLSSLSMCGSHVFFHSYLAPGTPPLRLSVTLSSRVQSHLTPDVQFAGPNAFFHSASTTTRRGEKLWYLAGLGLMLTPPFLPTYTCNKRHLQILQKEQRLIYNFTDRSTALDVRELYHYPATRGLSCLLFPEGVRSTLLFQSNQ